MPDAEPTSINGPTGPLPSAHMADSTVSASSASEPTELDRETLVVAGVVMLGAIMSILDTTVVNVAIDRLAIDFHSSLTTIQWVVTGYTLSLAAVIPLSGWAADRFGTKRLYLTSLVLFTMGSILSGLAWSAGSLIAFRVLQGLGGGMIMPAVMTIMTQKAGPQRMGRVMGILGVPMLIAPILGPILGGWLVDSASWRWIFFINVPIGVVAFTLAMIKLESDIPAPSTKLDWIGMLLLSPGLALLIYGLAESSTYGFADLRSWGPVLAGVVLIAGFFLRSWRAKAPLIDIRTFTRTSAGASAIVFLLFAISFFGALLLIPLYYQSVRGATALQAGLLLAPQGIGAMITMPIAGRLTDRYGPRYLPAAGIPLLVIGLAPFAFVGAHTSYVLLCAFQVILGLGMGLAMMPTMTSAMQAVPRSAIARTSTAMNIIRQGGASIGTAVVTVVLSSAIVDRLSFIPAVRNGGGNGFAALQRLTPAQHAVVAKPLASAFAHTFTLSLILLGIAFVPALFMALRKSASPAPAQIRSDVPVAVE
jgi:EmrB/QacA subfamily drug resistance transporter